ncbi:Piso0_000211 [Millerozyma farinosa CBS 7064]|uniref:Piso0_000211 protein n=1 Tax=Pichia sorbitophila (strain ATCC MYA-4447 / BCRC 22081 / CBS 7064 / NBRC 10061 / NRRL Y-12695) TaxID=559304 RepID=G8YTD7_PICSO|nr:Piso0_000211 [Millerozyma farinosa CBS 7064]
MPCTEIDYSDVKSIIGDATGQQGSQDMADDRIITTPFGLALLDIQGELNIPDRISEEADSISGGTGAYITIDEIYHAVSVGKLHINENNPREATLLVGKSQKLIGTVDDLKPPLAVMRIPNREQEAQAGEQVKIVDILRKKVVFKNRPLPVM